MIETFHFNRALSYFQQREIALAALDFQRALQLGMDPLAGLSQRWTTWMLLGDFEKAWQETDRIEQARHDGTPIDGHLVWNGDCFHNQRVLLRCNHGIGDAIQFIRYAELIKQTCPHLTVKAKPIVLPLLRSIGWIDNVVSQFDADPSFDVEVECMELPYVFRTTVESIPVNIPYIGDGMQSTSSRIRSSRPKVGVVWLSGPWNPARSIALEELDPVFANRQVSFHSLQWGRWLREDLVETTQAISQMDLVLTVDTMTAHLAGAMGKPVWMLLSFDSDWRWMLARHDSPWYPTMRLFRQQRRGDWSSPVLQVAAALSEFEHSNETGLQGQRLKR